MTDSLKSQISFLEKSIDSSMANVLTDYHFELIDKKFQSFFNQVNHYYLIDDSINDTTIKDEHSWIIYYVNNCVIERPIGWIDGAIKIEDNNIRKNCSNSLIIMKLNRKNRLQLNDFRRLKTNSEKAFRFCFDSFYGEKIEKKFIINSSLNPSKNFVLETDAKMYVHVETLKIFENDKNALPITQPATVEIQSGCIDLFFSADDSIYICRSQSDQEFRIRIVTENYQIDYATINKELLHEKNETRAMIEKKNSLKPRISLSNKIIRRNLIQLADMKQTLSSLLKTNLISKTRNNEFNENEAKENIKNELETFETVKNHTDEPNNYDEQPSNQETQMIIRSKESSEIQLETNDEQQPKALDLLESNEAQSEMTKIFQNYFQKTKAIPFDEIEKFIKLDSVLIVKKIKLNNLASSSAVISSQKSIIADQSVQSLSSPVTESTQTSPSITDREILRKSAIHHIQKCIRYLEHVDNFVANNKANFNEGMRIFR